MAWNFGLVKYCGAQRCRYLRMFVRTSDGIRTGSPLGSFAKNSAEDGWLSVGDARRPWLISALIAANPFLLSDRYPTANIPIAVPTPVGKRNHSINDKIALFTT